MEPASARFSLVSRTFACVDGGSSHVCSQVYGTERGWAVQAGRKVKWANLERSFSGFHCHQLLVELRPLRLHVFVYRIVLALTLVHRKKVLKKFLFGILTLHFGLQGSSPSFSHRGHCAVRCVQVCHVTTFALCSRDEQVNPWLLGQSTHRLLYCTTPPHPPP